jgi:hypothetical protein
VRDDASLDVHRHVAEVNHGWPALRLDAPAKQRADASDQLGKTKRLGDVIVRADTESVDLVDFFALGAQDYDRHAEPVAAERLEDAIAVDSREHEVENDEVGRISPRCRDRARAVARSVDLVPLGLE